MEIKIGDWTIKRGKNGPGGSDDIDILTWSHKNGSRVAFDSIPVNATPEETRLAALLGVDILEKDSKVS